MSRLFWSSLFSSVSLPFRPKAFMLPPSLLLSARGTPSSPLFQWVIIGATVAIAASAILLAVVFLVLWKRLPHKRRQYNVELGPSQRPLLRRLETDFPVEMKPAYLDIPRARRASIIADPLSPLAASQQPGFVPRPIPVNIPMSVSGSRAPSMRFNPHQSSSGVSPEDLTEILDELSRHYVLREPGSPNPRHGHRYSTSLTGRSRGVPVTY
ncbi:hypothetical protein C8R44DRAFT_129013 [Mycena epipterygia]|nr:hypothetical protein C8R44DRAFT_129013 [Mycena epipterygia]